jgi:cytoskeleton protein RodZ
MSTEPTFGKYLGQCRQRAGLSVQAVSTGSRIVPRFVEALEAEQHAVLPAPVYVRGFIRAYCEQVGADVEHAIRLYDAQAIPDPSLTVQPTPPAATAKPVVRRWGRVVAVAVIVVALGATAVLLGGRRQPDAAASRGGAAPTAPDASAPRAAVTPAQSSAPAEAPAMATSPPAERVLLIRAVEVTWVRVQPHGGPPAEETLAPGTVREWRSPKGFRLTAGNAGGILLELDGRPLPALGDRGQVVHTTIPLEPRP